MKKLLLLFALFQLPNDKMPDPAHSGYAPIVDGIQSERPAPYPCNLSVTTPNGSLPVMSSAALSVCITGPEKYWTCADKERVLLTSEDGKHFCMKVQFD